MWQRRGGETDATSGSRHLAKKEFNLRPSMGDAILTGGARIQGNNCHDVAFGHWENWWKEEGSPNEDDNKEDA
jgi:hypothetical protein